MTPPGRRKIPTLTIVSIFLLLFSSTASAAAAVLGIDLGTEFLKAAIAKPGSPIEVVLTKDSKRKEAAALAFKPSRAQIADPEAFPERLYGGDAIALAARYPGDVYQNLKSLLGVSSDSGRVTEYTDRYPGLAIEKIPRDEGGNGKEATVGFRSQNFGGEKREVFMVEELLAMQLKNIKANAEAGLPKGTVVTDAVITYPAFFTAGEKRAVELAADLAGLRLLGMISDGLAVGLNYATTRTFDSVTEGAQPEYHLVYDMGAGSTTATVLKFQGRTIKDYGKRNKTIQEVQVLSSASDQSLGGNAFTDVIVTDMINKFVQTPRPKAFGLESIHVKRHAKTMARFWKEASRMRQMLSANTLTTANLEGVYYDDVNFKYSLDRDQFEALIKTQSARVSAPLVEALDNAGISLTELDSIILHGGAVRTPSVQKQLEAVAGGPAKIKTNVNADEAAVLGAAFKAASLSSSFRVKEIRSTDISGTAFNLKWTSEGKEKQQKLFTPASQVGIEKQVPINILQDVSFQFSQLTDTEKPISVVEATNLTKSTAELQSKGCVAANISTVFNIRLSPTDGLPEIISGSVSCKPEAGKDGGVLDNVKGLFGFGGKKDSEQEVLEDDEQSEAESTTLTPLPVSDPTSSGETISATSPAESASESDGSATPTTPTKSKKSSKPKSTPSLLSIALSLKASPLGLNKPPTSSLPRLRERLVQFDTSDRNLVLRSEALNTLESFTYRARDYLSDDSFIAVSSDKVRQELEEQLTAASEWLYTDGVDAKLQDFQDKFTALKAIVEPVLRRKDESAGRDAAIKSLRDGLENMAGMIEMVNMSMQRAAEEAASSLSSTASSVAEKVTASTSEGDDLEDDPYSTTSTTAPAEEPEMPVIKPYEYTAQDLSSLTTIYDSVKSWLDEKLAVQEKLSPYDDPAMLISELEIRSRQLQTSISDLIMKSIRTQESAKKGKKSSSSKKAKSKKSRGSSTSSDHSESSQSSTTGSVKSTSRKDEL